VWDEVHNWVVEDFCSSFPPPAQAYGAVEGMQFIKNNTANNAIGGGSSSIDDDDDSKINNGSNINNTIHVGLPHDPALVSACHNWVSTLDAWHLSVLYSAVAETKSFFLGAAVLLGTHNCRSVQAACRVEEDLQIEAWGLVEGQHDYDILNCSIQLGTASCMARALRQATAGGGDDASRR
jgi:hypothetical protein